MYIYTHTICYIGWPRIWRFPGQFTFFDSGHFKFGRSHEDGAHVAG